MMEEEEDDVIDLNILEQQKKGGMGIEEQHIDWEFYDPSEDQFHSVKVLTTRMLHTISECNSELANVIVENAGLGTMIGMADDEVEKTGNIKSTHVYACSTILHMATYKDNAAIRDLLNWLAKVSENENTKHEAFMNYINMKKVGLIINERYLNLPQPLIPMLHKQVLTDQQWALENDKEFCHEYSFDYLIAVAKIQKELKPTLGKKKVGSGGINEADDAIIWYNYEDEIFKNKSLVHFFVEDKKEIQKGGSNLITGRCIMVLKYDSYVNVVQKLS